MLYHVRLMRSGDVDEVTGIDREGFPTMKPPTNFQRELGYTLAHYIVACNKDRANDLTGAEVAGSGKPYIVGFAGIWLLADEAHIVNIAVRQEYRRQGIGELLLISLIELAIEINASLITLEVRASNDAARCLYGKYGFTVRGVRRGYYSDNREDAVIMTVDNINSALFRACLGRLKKAHSEKWGTSLCQIVH